MKDRKAAVCKYCGAKVVHYSGTQEEAVCHKCLDKVEVVKAFSAECEKFKKLIGYEDYVRRRRGDTRTKINI